MFCTDQVLNISAAYLRPELFAFGGSCLPKDVRAFLAMADLHNLEVPLLRGGFAEQPVDCRTRLRRDRELWAATSIAMFGLAFKQGTDDLRESPFVLLAERLLGRGYELRIFDRSIDVARLIGSNRAYIENEIPHLQALAGAPAPAEALSGTRLAVIGHIGPTDFGALCTVRLRIIR